MNKHVETLVDIRNEYAAYDNAHHQLAALDAAIALMREQSVAVDVNYDKASRWASEMRVDYNWLCRAIRDCTTPPEVDDGD